MSAHAAAPSLVHPPLTRRIAALCCIAISTVFLLNDFGVVTRADLLFESLARAVMLGLAAFMVLHWPARATYEKQRILLLWGLIGLSLDVYWQVAYGGPAQWAAMVVKYVGVPAGLACFIALTASFGEGSRLRGVLSRVVAPAFGIVLAVVGIVHGCTWMQHCTIAIGNCYVDDPLSTWSFRGYFALDAFGRLLTLLAALAGLVSSPENRQRLLLIVVSCAVLSLGTALDLSTRFLEPSANYLALVQTTDALTTLAFAVGIFLALKRGLLFDVVYVITRGTVYLCSFFALLVLMGTFEGSVHWGGSSIAEKMGLIGILPGGKYTIDVLVSIVCVFGLKRFEDRAADTLAVRVLGDEEKCIERMQNFQRQIGVFNKSTALTAKLLDVLRTTARASSVDVFVRNADGAYVAIASSREPKPGSVRIDQLPRRLQGFHETWLRSDGCVPGACIALPMPVGGRLFGFLACGPKPENIAYTKEEVHEIFGIARETGAALFVLGGYA